MATKTTAQSNGLNGSKEHVNRLPVEQKVQITRPKWTTAEFRIVGTAPYCQNAFSQKALNQIKETQLADSQAKARKKREPKDFQACYEAAMHKTAEGWPGIPATAFRNAMIDACRLVGFKMTHAKLAVFIEADGYDALDHTPLVKIEGEPQYSESFVRPQASGVDIRPRPLWPTWKATVRIKFDGEQFSLLDMTNLVYRAGEQVGIGEGRPNSPNSNGLGWGTFTLESE